MHERLREAIVVQVDDVLHHVVAEGILDKDNRFLGNALDEPNLLNGLGMVDEDLEQTAAVAVRANRQPRR